MIKSIILFSLVAVSLAQWVDPDWSRHLGLWKNNQEAVKRYPPLPGSVQVFDNANSIFAATTTPPPSSSSPATTSPPATTTQPPETACQKMFGCYDCNTAEVCMPDSTGKLVQISNITCPSDKPYCDFTSGTCTTIADSHCGASDTFICPDNGYFPDPTDCATYHVCNDYKSSKFTCVNGQRYDADNTQCNSKVSCQTVNCTGEAQVKVELANTHYFAYCRNGAPFIMSRCQGEYKLNATSQNCEPICEQDGLMADATLCTSFYKCSTIYITAAEPISVREHLSCPTGEAFQATSYQCVPQAMTDCK